MKPLLVLDLDYTLVFSEIIEIEGKAPDFILDFGQEGTIYTYVRPYLKDLFEYAFEHFNVAVWTSASKDYAEQVLQKLGILDKLYFVWYRDTIDSSFTTPVIKDLNKVSKAYAVPMCSILIVDDDISSACRNHDNLVRINPYHGRKQDNELLRLVGYLQVIKDEPDFRTAYKNVLTVD